MSARKKAHCLRVDRGVDPYNICNKFNPINYNLSYFVEHLFLQFIVILFMTRILFHALRKMDIPTVIFINKIDQTGVDLQGVYQSVRDKLSADIIIKQTVSLSSKITMNYWKSISQENQSAGKNLRRRNSGGFKTPPCSRSIMAAPKRALAFNR